MNAPRSDNKRQKAKEDIEITPKMVEAGMNVLMPWLDSVSTLHEELVKEIFTAMLLASSSNPKGK